MQLIQIANYFRATTFDRDITPYIHTFVYHVQFFAQKYGNLKVFETEGLEHLNLINKLVFFGATNHGKENFTITEQVEIYNFCAHNWPTVIYFFQ